MGKRSGRAGETLSADRVSLDDLNQQIANLEWRYRDGKLNASLRRDTFKTLLWLEAERERLHGIAAPVRKMARRT